jgi:hypothetical protein
MARPRDDRIADPLGKPGKGGNSSMFNACRRSSAPGDTHRASDRKLRCAMAVALLTLMQSAAFAGAVPAARFDDKVKAPPAPGNAELKAVIRDYFDTYARVNANSTAGIVRDKAAYQQWFETQWRLQRAIDQKRPLGDLSEFGLTANADGSYSVDLAQYPQWDPLVGDLQRLSEPSVLDYLMGMLQERGLRDRDAQAIRQYVARNASRPNAAQLDITEGFGSRAKAQIAARRKVDSALLLAYFYQNGRVRHERERAWAQGLLDVLDPHGQRIVESYFREQAGQLTIGPEDLDLQAKFVVESITSGDFSRQMQMQRSEAQK